MGLGQKWGVGEKDNFALIIASVGRVSAETSRCFYAAGLKFCMHSDPITMKLLVEFHYLRMILSVCAGCRPAGCGGELAPGITLLGDGRLLCFGSRIFACAMKNVPLGAWLDAAWEKSGLIS